MVFFTDGSSNNNELVIGARVTYKEFNGDFSPWTDLAYTALNTKDSNTAELLGINGALSVIFKFSRSDREERGEGDSLPYLSLPIRYTSFARYSISLVGG